VGVVGWTDFNLVLDTDGGPNWAGLKADAPILVEKDGKQFYKQPMFYALAHFAKFLVPASTVIDVDTKLIDKSLKGKALEKVLDALLRKFFLIAVLRPDGYIVRIIVKSWMDVMCCIVG
jgi:hypothetical protein